MSRSAKCLFESVSADQRCRTIVLIHVANFFRNVDPCMFGVHLLITAGFCKDWIHILGLHWLLGSRIERRKWLVRHVGLNIIPL